MDCLRGEKRNEFVQFTQRTVFHVKVEKVHLNTAWGETPFQLHGSNLLDDLSALKGSHVKKKSFVNVFFWGGRNFSKKNRKYLDLRRFSCRRISREKSPREFPAKRIVYLHRFEMRKLSRLEKFQVGGERSGVGEVGF